MDTGRDLPRVLVIVESRDGCHPIGDRHDLCLTREDLLGQHPVDFGVGVKAAIGEHHKAKVSICGFSQCREHHTARGDSGKHECVEPCFLG